MQTQSIGKTYAQIIKFGRLLEDHTLATKMSKERPELILGFVESVERQLRFTEVDEFFALFPPIKRYGDDGTWDYNSTLEMRRDRLGTHFGKDDFKHLIMSSCYENRFVQLVGLSFMCSISSMHKKQTGRILITEFIDSQQKSPS